MAEFINSERLFKAALEEFCKEKSLTLESLCHDWVFYIKSGDDIIFSCFGFDIGLNSSAASKSAHDKSACYEILKINDIPAIEHYLILPPGIQKNYLRAQRSSWHKMIEYLNKYGEIIIKRNKGTSGNFVEKISSEVDLDKCAIKIFDKGQAIAISPYYDIDKEIRCIMLNDECLLCYVKEPPEVKGNGQDPISILIAKQGIDVSACDSDLDLNKIPDKGEVIQVGWKHNLSKGARARLLNEDDLYYDSAINMARQSMKALGISYASVDIACIDSEMRVMEINSGVMIERLANFIDKRTVMSVYKKALEKRYEEAANKK